MDPPAAGIIPYIVNNNKVYFLLGKEKGKWSGFVGGYEDKDQYVINTAVREFNEETAMIFEKYTKYMYIKMKKTRPVLDKTPSGRNVYIWFIEFPINSLNEIVHFEWNKKLYNTSFFNEKSDIRVFELDEIKNSKEIFYLCKKRIIKNFQ